MPVLIFVVFLIVIGVAIAWRSATSKSRGPMADQERDALSSAGMSSLTPGLWCLVCGFVAAISVAMIGQATYGWVSGFDPPGWLRIVAFWMLPAGVIAAAILGTLSLKQNSGRLLGITGLALAALSVGAFFVMLVSVDY